MSSYDVGFQDGLSGIRQDHARRYQTAWVENNYWKGYLAGMVQANPGKHIVQCTREGRIFATDNVNDCLCPSCGRRYINGESDRKLKVVQ